MIPACRQPTAAVRTNAMHHGVRAGVRQPYAYAMHKPADRCTHQAAPTSARQPGTAGSGHPSARSGWYQRGGGAAGNLLPVAMRRECRHGQAGDGRVADFSASGGLSCCSAHTSLRCSNVLFHAWRDTAAHKHTNTPGSSCPAGRRSMPAPSLQGSGPPFAAPGRCMCECVCVCVSVCVLFACACASVRYLRAHLRLCVNASKQREAGSCGGCTVVQSCPCLHGTNMQEH